MKKYKTFAVECKVCTLKVCYGFSPKTLAEDKRDAAKWFISFMWPTAWGAAKDKEEPVPICARLGWDKLGRNGNIGCDDHEEEIEPECSDQMQIAGDEVCEEARSPDVEDPSSPFVYVADTQFAAMEIKSEDESENNS